MRQGSLGPLTLNKLHYSVTANLDNLAEIFSKKNTRRLAISCLLKRFFLKLMWLAECICCIGKKHINTKLTVKTKFVTRSCRGHFAMTSPTSTLSLAPFLTRYVQGCIGQISARGFRVWIVHRV